MTTQLFALALLGAILAIGGGYVLTAADRAVAVCTTDNC